MHINQGTFFFFGVRDGAIGIRTRVPHPYKGEGYHLSYNASGNQGTFEKDLGGYFIEKKQS